jgi:1-deoxy-D-xylulose-5-phosphate reductoisomerase
MAQLGVTDMRLPIQYALSHPERWEAPIPGLDFDRPLSLEFQPPDRDRFPCLELAYGALRAGGSMPAVLNAANEEAVGAFLQERIAFPAIADSVAAVMAAHRPAPLSSLEDVLAADAWARESAQARLRGAAARAIF